MLDELHISNVALIRDAWFAPAESFTVITGETGSGKTALLNAFKLLVGARAESGIVREGEDELTVEGRFFSRGSDEEDLVVRRISSQGRSRVSINGSMSSVKELASGIGASVDLCGQHEHQRLMDANHQRELLDSWGGEVIASALEAYRIAFAEVHEAKKNLDRCQEEMNSDAHSFEDASFVVRRIEEINPQPGEYESLLADLPRFEHAESLLMSAASIRERLSGDSSVLEKTDEVIASLETITRIDPSLSSSLQMARDAYYSLEDVLQEVSSYAASIDFSQEELESKQERVAQFQGLMRSYGPRMDDVFECLGQSKAFLARFESRDELLSQAQIRLDEAWHNLSRAAHDLARVRREILPEFLGAVNAQLERLEMGSARIEGEFIDLEQEKWTKDGSQSFELLFVPGQELKPQKLNHVASGGELSRVMLAIKVVLGERDEVDTLVFDEIDSGVGGQTALALASVLKDLSKTHQIIVVTHLAQVAACADKHFCVRKLEDETLQTEVKKLSEADRIKEIARMLSGEVTQTSLAHAEELLGRNTNS